MQIPAKEHQPTRLVSCCCVLNSAQLFLRTINSLGEGKKKSTREEVPEGELGYSAAAETASPETDSKVHSSFAKTPVLYTKNRFRRHTLITDDRLNRSPNQTWIRELEKCLSTGKQEQEWREGQSSTMTAQRIFVSFVHRIDFYPFGRPGDQGSGGKVLPPVKHIPIRRMLLAFIHIWKIKPRDVHGNTCHI
ncbi:uncharacterized protein LOC144327333 isoform X1 [Podarcis muralis]